MPTTNTPRKHFLAFFAIIVFSLLIIRCANPAITQPRTPSAGEQSSTFLSRKLSTGKAATDSIETQQARIDSLLLRPRPDLQLTDSTGKPVKNRVTSVRSFAESFPDLNDVQLATAQRIGISSIADRQEAMRRKKDLVYIGDTPFYHVNRLSHSIPYLVPRAATLLTEISRAFVDSLASKGLPFHKVVITSVLRTRSDIDRLRRINHNASENSCHQYGTTFDIAYNQFIRVQDPDGPEQPQTWGVTLKSVLAEVLEDQRLLGTCYVKYERKQACFHVTAR